MIERKHSSSELVKKSKEFKSVDLISEFEPLIPEICVIDFESRLKGIMRWGTYGVKSEQTKALFETIRENNLEHVVEMLDELIYIDNNFSKLSEELGMRKMVLMTIMHDFGECQKDGDVNQDADISDADRDRIKQKQARFVELYLSTVATNDQCKVVLSELKSLYLEYEEGKKRGSGNLASLMVKAIDQYQGNRKFLHNLQDREEFDFANFASKASKDLTPILERFKEISLFLSSEARSELLSYFEKIMEETYFISQEFDDNKSDFFMHYIKLSNATRDRVLFMQKK